ncbi:MAG: hypothetical protein U1F70_07175 [Candidatus Competibacteraceae bacterium]
MRRFPWSLLRTLVLLPSLALVLLIRVIKWLIAPLALLFQLLLGVPLALLQVRQPLRPRFIPIQEADLPDAAWIELTDAAEALAADGFVHYGDFRGDGLIQNAVLWLRLLGQPEQGIGAIATWIEISGGTRLARGFIEFATEFSDRRVLATNNLSLPYSLPAPDYLARLQLKDVWDARALYVLHRDLVAALGQPISLAKTEQAIHDPVGLLVDGYAREIQALIAQGWLRSDAAAGMARLNPWGALVGVWRQAWPLASLHLRAADRRARHLLAEHGIDAEAFIGGAPGIVVASQPLPAPAAIETARAGYEQVLPLARRTDPQAVLEAVTAELDRNGDAVLILELRYSFRGCADQNQRRIRRWRGFDIVLDPEAGELAVTAMERELEQAADDAEWAELTARSPLIPLVLGPWLHDLDSVLPVALATLDARTGTGRATLDSASLYGNEDGAPYWQVVAWNGEDDPPLHIRMDARSGAILPET